MEKNSTDIKKALKSDLHKLGIKTYLKKSTGEVFVKKNEIEKAVKKATAEVMHKMTFEQIKEAVKSQAIKDGLKVIKVVAGTFSADKDSGVNAEASQVFEVYENEKMFAEYCVRAVVGNGFFLEIKQT